QRLVTPWYALAFSLIALAALLSGDFNRQGQTLRVITAVSCIVVLESTSISSQSLAIKDFYLLPLVYINCITPLLAGVIYLLRPPRRRPIASEEPTGGSLARGS
ncbi:MAG: hypothetical protein ACHQF3_03410, partial [Alphaproteobacteria bacterium]